MGERVNQLQEATIERMSAYGPDLTVGCHERDEGVIVELVSHHGRRRSAGIWLVRTNGLISHDRQIRI